MQAARRAEQELGAEIIVIKKTSKEYAAEKNPPPAPSVVVDGKLVVADGTVTYEELEDALGKG